MMTLLVLFLLQAAAARSAPQTETPEADLARELERTNNLIARTIPGSGSQAPSGYVFRAGVLTPVFEGAWWTSPLLVDALGLSASQQSGIEVAFDDHREAIVDAIMTLESEESRLADLLEADPINRNAVFAQIDTVVRARGAMEREASVMALEMREVLTAAQWVLLQQPGFGRMPAPAPAGPGGRGGRGRGAAR